MSHEHSSSHMGTSHVHPTSHNMEGTPHDHTADGAAMDHMGHGVAFKWKVNSTVLWDFWTIETGGQYAWSVVVIVLMGLLREFIVFSRRTLRKRYNEYLEEQRNAGHGRRSTSSAAPLKVPLKPQSQVELVTGRGPANEEGREDSMNSTHSDSSSAVSSATPDETQPLENNAKPKWYLHQHFVRFLDSALYILQVTMSYFLMFVAMTFNAGLFIAVVLGLGLGYFVLLSQFPEEQSQKKHWTFQGEDRPKQDEMGEDCCN